MADESRLQPRTDRAGHDNAGHLVSPAAAHRM